MVWVSFPDYPSLQAAQPHHYHVLAMPYSISRQKSFVLFSCFPWHSHPDKDWVFSLTNSYGMHLVIPAYLSLFWVVYHSSETFPPKELKWESQNRLPPSPYRQTIPSLTSDSQPTTPILFGYKWCLSLMHTLLSCKSMACLLFMRLPWPVSLSGLCCTFCYLFLTSCGVNESPSLHSLHLISFFGLGLAWVQALLPSIQPLSFFTSSLWVNQCSCHAMSLLLPCYHLTCACQASFGSAMHFSLIQFMLPDVSASLIPIPSWAFLAHFIPLGILDLLYSFGHPWPILFLHSHRRLLCLFAFPGPIIISFTFEVCWSLYQSHLLIPFFRLLRPIFACFPFLIIPIGLQLPSLGSLGPVCFLWSLFTILQAHGSLFLPFEFNGFLLALLILLPYSLFLSILLGFFLLLGLLAKVGINKYNITLFRNVMKLR